MVLLFLIILPIKTNERVRKVILVQKSGVAEKFTEKFAEIDFAGRSRENPVLVIVVCSSE